MAENASVELDSETGADYADHARMYGIFLGMVKYCTAAVVIVLILLAFLLY